MPCNRPIEEKCPDVDSCVDCPNTIGPRSKTTTEAPKRPTPFGLLERFVRPSFLVYAIIGLAICYLAYTVKDVLSMLNMILVVGAAWVVGAIRRYKEKV